MFMGSGSSDTKDRKLGDEWQTWDGTIIQPGEIRAGNRLFLTLLFAAILLVIAALFFFTYLITPRLAQYSPALPRYVAFTIGGLSVAALSWFVIVLLVLNTRNARFCFCIGNRFFLAFSTLASRIGNRLGISRDRVGHSFIKVSNALMLASLKAKSNRKVLVLLPRCLSKESRAQVMDICSHYPLEVKTVSGGEAARDEVGRFLPDAVVGIACERDLVSGIRDVASQIPVFGVPNIRPHGPCKGTSIDFSELENTLRFVCGSQS